MTQVLNEAMCTFRKEIAERRSSIEKGWNAFKTDASPFHVAEVIDRSATDLPDDFVPWAPGVVVTSEYLLRAAGYSPRARQPKGWKKEREGVYKKLLHNYHLTVCKCGDLWIIERPIDTVLAYRYGSLPVVTRDRKAAMWLAEYCSLPPSGEERYHGRPLGVARPLTWVGSTPSGIRYL
jgi:hypothetical protein